MSSDTKAIIGTIVATGVGVAVLLAGFMYVLIGGVNTRIDDVNTRIDDVNGRIGGLDVRLGVVERWTREHLTDIENARQLRDALAEVMSAEEIAAAQEAARER